ncbi:hypothetical protein TNCT_533963 [Trichonephila clavata]|uniref:Ubiquitin-like protease family profile domain-containing protein n=1 Tax=Trichonephila clavata TaxID=2740835 RepID=A0A8X6F9I1_TRICU|nr:hypothetical protein TNCT_533963 [Trichonephila clavata]
MNQASSNSNMPRSTVETLKQIQAKQGLSISIVGQDNSRSSFPLDSSVSKEMKPKHIVTIDKNTKLPNRSSIATENKSTLSHVKSVPSTSSESRASGAQSVLTSNQSSFQETKISGNINKSVTPTVSSTESRAFGSQSWSNPPSSANENKPQGSSVRGIQSGTPQPDSKNPGSCGRVLQSSAVFTENKILNCRVIQNISQLTDNKSQSRNSQVTVTESKNQVSHRLSQSQLTFEGKVQANQNRITVGSPPLEVKAINTNQVRSNQTPVFVHESKSSAGQRTINQMLNQNKANLNKSTDVKIPNQIRVSQGGKNVPVERFRPGNKSVSESSSVNLPMSERTLNNPFRVASTLGTKVSASTEEKSLLKVTHVSQNISVVSESKTAAHSKISSQNMSVHSESKAVSQVVKVSSVSPEVSQKSSVSFDNSSNPATSKISAMSTPRGTTLKRSQTSRVTNSTPKKKCTKRACPSTSDDNAKHVQAAIEATNFSSDEGSPKDKFFNMKGLTPGLTITPVRKNAPTVSSASGNIKKTALGASSSTMVNCPFCQQMSMNLSVCDHCHARFPTPIQQIPLNRQAEVGPSYVVQNVMTTKIKQFVIYEGQKQSIQIQHAVQGMVGANVSPRPKGRPRSRRKFEEPVCYTLSSDEEEPVQVPFHPILDETQGNVSQLFPVDSEGSKSEHSSASEVMHDDSQEFDDPQFPGVTDINESVEIEEEPDEEEEEEMEYENEAVEEEEEEELDESVGEEEEEIPSEEHEQEAVHGQRPTDYPLRCRSVRIGSYKVHPAGTQPHVPVNLAAESISFQAPSLTEPPKVVLISIRSHDITKVLVHFGRCLPIMYIYTTPSFGEAVRNALHMTQGDARYFDPTTKDDKTQKLTFLIDSMTDEQRHFIRQIFPGDKKVKEIDQKQANEILVKSTPNQVPVSKIQLQQHQQQQPTNIIKLLTYPPPPQTGGIAVTNEDLQCLNEGEFLNDAIIDFYLKYIFNEKLTPTQRDKTYIFSSFFYPRLTHKAERARPGDDTTKTVAGRRHNQVKTWTRHVDIFSKDFIIIPVNQNVHWFLAIICYPGLVPESPNVPSKSEIKNSKSSDNVTSTVEQESGSKVIIKELNSNGDGDSSNADDNSMNSSGNSPYLVEEPPDSDEPPETPDSSTHPDGKQRAEMPCICIFDSLSATNRWRIPQTLRDYLEMEWKMKKGTRKTFNKDTMQGFFMKCPQQTNYSDCGMYLLQFVESFFENPMP